MDSNQKEKDMEIETALNSKQDDLEQSSSSTLPADNDKTNSDYQRTLEKKYSLSTLGQKDCEYEGWPKLFDQPFGISFWRDAIDDEETAKDRFEECLKYQWKRCFRKTYRGMVEDFYVYKIRRIIERDRSNNFELKNVLNDIEIPNIVLIKIFEKLHWLEQDILRTKLRSNRWKSLAALLEKAEANYFMDKNSYKYAIRNIDLMDKKLQKLCLTFANHPEPQKCQDFSDNSTQLLDESDIRIMLKCFCNTKCCLNLCVLDVGCLLEYITNDSLARGFVIAFRNIEFLRFQSPKRDRDIYDAIFSHIKLKKLKTVVVLPNYLKEDLKLQEQRMSGTPRNTTRRALNEHMSRTFRLKPYFLHSLKGFGFKQDRFATYTTGYEFAFANVEELSVGIAWDQNIFLCIENCRKLKYLNIDVTAPFKENLTNDALIRIFFSRLRRTLEHLHCRAVSGQLFLANLTGGIASISRRFTHCTLRCIKLSGFISDEILDAMIAENLRFLDIEDYWNNFFEFIRSLKDGDLPKLAFLRLRLMDEADKAEFTKIKAKSHVEQTKNYEQSEAKEEQRQFTPRTVTSQDSAPQKMKASNILEEPEKSVCHLIPLSTHRPWLYIAVHRYQVYHEKPGWVFADGQLLKAQYFYPCRKIASMWTEFQDMEGFCCMEDRCLKEFPLSSLINK
ncbi:unnamed protein product [Thelazia callipaeda]|uniref:F-box domain-containing protein n=1 Tax=Thelazia callipaeda TaxID=103827 RepID=A0A0N5CMN5_THECL|nr:unnamed protein product [Thelazia callipaeda]